LVVLFAVLVSRPETVPAALLLKVPPLETVPVTVELLLKVPAALTLTALVRAAGVGKGAGVNGRRGGVIGSAQNDGSRRASSKARRR